MRALGNLALGLTLLATSFVSAETADVFTDIARISEAGRAERGAPALSVAVAVDGTLIWADGFGIADVENDVPARADSVYRIASISKPIAATAVMQLIEQGKVSLDAPIRNFVPSLPARDHPVTIRHLLTHTSGIRHYKDGEFDMRDHFDDIDDAIAIFKDDPLLFTPGSQYSYSTYAYNLLVAVIEQASGLVFESYMRENVWTPAGMNETYLEHQGPLVPHRVRQYVKAGTNGSVRNAPFADLSIKWSGGGMISTVEDLTRFSIALDEGELLSEASLQTMYTPFTLNDGTQISRGLSWDTAIDDEGRLWVSHGGGATGGSTYLLRLPERKLAVALCANVQDAGTLRELAMEIAETVLESR